MIEVLYKKPEAIYLIFVTEEHFLWNYSVIIQKIVNPFVHNAPFLYPQKTYSFLMFSGV